jgi:phospholipase/carboxylesterase
VRGPHQGQPVLTAGDPVERASAAAVMVHGRGAGAADMMGLAGLLRVPGIAFLAPQAADNTWYPNRFTAPIDSNEPWLSSALTAIGDLLARIEGAGVSSERTMLLGFSQGACLTLEYVARHARRYGGVAGLSGGLIGPDGTPRDYEGSLDGTPIFLGCSDVDPHIPEARVHHSTEVLRRLGAEVTERIYPRMGHTINEDEIEEVRAMLEAVRAG